MNIESLLEQFDTGEMSALIGLAIGLTFGIFAQQSRFCLRAACVEFWRGQTGKKFSIWLLAFAAAMIGTQYFIGTGAIDTGQIRQLNNAGSMSGAIIGGLMFGAGMVLAGGCASRLLVLSATGNMRTMVAGLVVTIVAQASLRGGLSPVREEISSWWLVDGSSRSFAQWLPPYGGLMLGVGLLVVALWLAKRHEVSKWWSFAAVITGLSVAMGWALTSWQASNSFDLVAVKSVSFTGPSADTLMGLINQPHLPLSFDVGLIPGVFLGALLAALLTREFKWQKFTNDSGFTRFFIGAALMGFGGMLAGGCAVGAGVTGGAVLLITAWVALFSMWIGAGVADWLVDRKADALKAAAAAHIAEAGLPQFAKATNPVQMS
ncbi:MAG TPA: YeeE/YedE family protein [Candidatus Thiothrix moscowensis]|uniref:YeeE/YedE family protein n=1 Tax=unclassified Thiothrix TaxID=2636184 RepID=UPI0025D75EE5|nr:MULTISPECIES: YeeE/YedE family protein [unclassified Thiothrix]HRJ52837.1 YeeE/YedE family protein [Candidatus Thiothrix moscowensis]HRJ94394.1 YeeE/YedE family protein [Candidatus Thiothrix moscowensis]